MSMQSFLKKASKKLVEDPDAEPEADGDTQKEALPTKQQAKNQGHQSSGTGKQSSGPVAKKGTRKKI